MRYRLWTNEESHSFARTITALRKARTASSTPKPTFGQKFSRLANNLQGGDAKIISQAQALEDAKILADLAATHLAANLIKKRQPTSFKKWQSALDKALAKYHIYGQSSFANTDLNEAAVSLIGRMRNLTFDPDYSLDCEFVKCNHLGYDTIDELLANKPLIVAPLTGDYLMAKIYTQYIKLKTKTEIQVAPITLNKQLKNQFILEIPENITEMAIYMDTIETGSTGHAIYSYLQAKHPNITIHEPSYERTEWEPSEKIRRKREQLGKLGERIKHGYRSKHNNT